LFVNILCIFAKTCAESVKSASNHIYKPSMYGYVLLQLCILAEFLIYSTTTSLTL